MRSPTVLKVSFSFALPGKVILAVLLTFFNPYVLADCQLQHLEPPFWWAGMQHPELQLMLHGKGIAKLDPDFSYPGVTLEKVHRVANPNYLYLDLKLSKTVLPGHFVINLSENSETKLSYRYELRERETGSSERKGFNQGDAIYLITPDRFANGDMFNDQVESLQEGVDREAKGGRHGGDIQGVINHLDYIAEMGFTQIWLNPVLQNDQAKYSYHGYSTTDFYQIDKRYGDNPLYRQLSHSAKNKGLGLIKDVILNHIGSEHWWMKDLPAPDWINHQATFSPTSHRREALHDPHGVVEDITHFADGWFVTTMPDLNQRNPYLAKYMIQNAIWWVEFADLSGIRVDTYSYSDKNFLADWTQRLMQEYPKFNIVGEEWSTNSVLVSYWQAGSHRYDDYDSKLPSVFDFPLQNALVNSLKNEENWQTGLRQVYEILATDFIYGDPSNLVIFPDNHDMSRIFSQLDEDINLYKIAMSFLLTTRGIPQIFYGTEILMKNPGTDDHGIIRSDFPGGWQNDLVNAFNANGLSSEQDKTQKFVKTLLNWRKNSDAVKNGKLTHYAPEKGSYVYFRHTSEDSVMVLINKNEQAIELETDRFKAMLKGKFSAVDIITGEQFSLGEHVALPAKSATILQLH